MADRREMISFSLHSDKPSGMRTRSYSAPPPKVHKKKQSAFKKALTADKNKASGVELCVCKQYSFEYGDHLCSLALDTAIMNLLKQLRLFQMRAMQRNRIRSGGKIRLTSGIRCIEKHIALRDLQYVILAQDLEFTSDEDVLYKRIEKLYAKCKEIGVPIYPISRKHKLGDALHSYPYVSAVGVLDDQGAEILKKTMVLAFDRPKSFRDVKEHLEELAIDELAIDE